MNSLFVRTLLWFIATVILTFVAMTIATVLDMDDGQRRRGPFGSWLALQLTEAAHAYETGGKDALAAALDRFQSVTETRGVLTDGRGRDLLTGEDRSSVLSEMRERRGGPSWTRDRSVIGRRSEDGKYVYFVVVQRGNVALWFLQPEIHLTVLALLAILSYAFARRLTNPVKRLQTAVESFGRGDLTVRVRSKRKDEIGALARTFDNMADRIETLLAAERRLLLDISHELRSPLARLSVAVELARDADDPGKHLDRIEKEAGRLNALVGELLQVTRAEGDASKLRTADVDLTALLDTLIEDARLEAEARGCRVEWTRRVPVTVRADAELLHRAIENVIRNAIRYTQPSTAVEVSVCSDNRSASVTVRDYGPGVPDEHLSRIFDAFYRVDPARDRASGGAGLGLSIARRAVELHGGDIQARNANPGLIVEIRLSP
jgi:two-component system sensor histidine kinase CpxA